MSLPRNKIIFAVILALGCAGAYVALHEKLGAKAQQAQAAVQVVRTAIATRKAVPVAINTNGYVTAFNTVDVRPQVQNVVRAVHVKEGQDVRAGQLLFTLDERNDLANVAKARAQLARDRADLINAEAGLKRNKELLSKNFIAQAAVDTSRSQVDSLRGTVQADIAAVQASEVALGYNRITATIDGRLGAITVHVGSLAQPGGTPLVTISQLDPITVGFSLPQRELSYIAAGASKGGVPIAVQLPDGREMNGKLIFIDNTVDPQSGMIRMKAKFSNADRLLWPGAFVNVHLVSHTLPDAIVIPAQAIVTGPIEKFVYVVQPDGTAGRRNVDVVTIQNGQAVVSGLKEGMRVVIEGAQNLKPNDRIKEVAATNAASISRNSANPVSS